MTSSPNAPIIDIMGGTRPDNGPNLFHSLKTLSIATGDTANFLNDSNLPTDNIVTRITGGQPSTVLGTIKTTDFGSANLFLMNPNGVIFGPTSSIDITGSLFVTTANTIEFRDGSTFNAIRDPGADALLTSAPPMAFGFFDAPASSGNASHIHVEGHLNVLEGKTLSVVGRDTIEGATTAPGIRIQGGTLVAPSGDIHIVSLASTGATTPLLPDQHSTVDFGPRGAIQLSDGAAISTDGPSGGAVVIRGGNVTVESGSSISSETRGDTHGRSTGIDIVADSLLATDSSTNISTRTFFMAKGNAGDISIRVGRFNLRNNATITSSAALFAGKAGNISINATESLIVDNGFISSQTSFTSGDAGNISIATPIMNVHSNAPSTITTESLSSGGNAGNISLHVDQLTLTKNAQITSKTDSVGQAGDITITAKHDVVISATASTSGSGILSSTSHAGSAGDIAIHTAQLTVRDGGRIESETSGTGAGGTVTVWGAAGVRSTADIVSVSAHSERNIASRISTITTGPGEAGNIALNVKRLSVVDGGEVTSRSTSHSQDAGSGGAIAVMANDFIDLADATISTSVAGGSNSGGNITLDANQDIHLNEGTTVTAESSGNGHAGTIELVAGERLRIDHSTVTARAERALGGNIRLTATELIHVADSDITTKVREGSESAGKISIDPDFVILQRSLIDTSANVGDGGDVSIVANTAILIDPSSRIDTSSQFGGDGTVDIRAPIQNLSEAIAPLPEDIIKVAVLYAEACASQKGGQYSSMVKRAHSIPALGRWLRSPLTVHGSGMGLTNIPVSESHNSDMSSSSRWLSLRSKMTRDIYARLHRSLPVRTCARTTG